MEFLGSITSEIGLATVETQGAGAFLIANLFGKSQYNDECLLNLSLRSACAHGQTHLRGHVRVRSNKQALCEAVADRIRVLCSNS